MTANHLPHPPLGGIHSCSIYCNGASRLSRGYRFSQALALLGNGDKTGKVHASRNLRPVLYMVAPSYLESVFGAGGA